MQQPLALPLFSNSPFFTFSPSIRKRGLACKAICRKGLSYGFDIALIGAVLTMFGIAAEVMTVGYVFLPF